MGSKKRTDAWCSCWDEHLPIPGLNAQPFIISTLVGPEVDARKPRERFQSSNNDGPLTGGYKHEQDKVRMVANFCYAYYPAIMLSFLPMSFAVNLALLSLRRQKWLLTKVTGDVVRYVDLPVGPLVPQTSSGGARVSIFAVCPHSNVSFHQGWLISIRI